MAPCLTKDRDSGGQVSISYVQRATYANPWTPTHTSNNHTLFKVLVSRTTLTYTQYI